MKVLKIKFGFLIVIMIVACNKSKQHDSTHEQKDTMSAMIHLSPRQQVLINLATDTAKIKTIFETSDFYGVAAIDENSAGSISSRVNGRIEELFIRNPGEEIKTGQPLYSIYSEELLSDENEFILATENQSKFSQQKNTVDALIDASRKKLLLWGLSDKQINELTKNKKTSPTVTFYSDINGYLSELNVNEGEYVSTGTTLFKIAEQSSIWVDAEVYQNEISYLYQTPEIIIQFNALPNETFSGKIIQNPPAMDENKKVAAVRIMVKNLDGKIKPGMMATVSIKRNQKKTLVIPKSAIVLGKLNSVWIETASGMFENRMIETGIENKTEVEILKGIKQGDIVVSSGGYLLNSAYILKNGAKSMPGMNM